MILINLRTDVEWRSKLNVIGSDISLSPDRHQANAGILSIPTLGTNSSEILSEIAEVQCSNTSRVRLTVISHTPMRSRFYHIHTVYKRNWDASCLMNLTQQSYLKSHIFQIPNLFHCVAESWWNMPFKGTRHGNGIADAAVAKPLRLWQHATELWRHAVWIRTVTSHNAWMGYEYSFPNLNRSRAIHKHDPHTL